MALTFNPFTGQLDYVSAASTTIEAAEKIQDEFDLYGVGAVGDVVIPSPNQTDAVESLTSNYYTGAAFGVITEFVTSTRVKVLVSGRLSGSAFQLSGLTFGQVLFISSTGKLTTTVPATGHLQKFGIALKGDTVFLLPSMDKVLRA